MAKLIAGKRRSPIPGWCAPCSVTSDRPSDDPARDLVRDRPDLRAQGLACGRDVLRDPRPHLGQRALRVLAGLCDQPLLLGLGLAHDPADLALPLAPGGLEGGVVLAPQPLDLRFERARLLDLTLGAALAFLDQAHRRLEPELRERDPQGHEEHDLEGEAVVQFEHAVRAAAWQRAAGVTLLRALGVD